MTQLFDLSRNGRIRATGEDRARLLHALSTNHIQQLKPGEQAYAFFLNAQGRILADAHILCGAESLLIDTEPETRTTLLQHIDHYIIADDVTLEDETDYTFSLELDGLEAADLAAHLPDRCAAFELGPESFRVYGPVTEKEALWTQLLRAGGQASDRHLFRVERFLPRYGEDITERTLPQETGLANALHFQKGCYLGQEIVERIRSRGHVNRMLSGLIFESLAPEPGTKLLAGVAEAGEITSSSGPYAIGMLRVSASGPVTAAGKPAVTQPVRAS